MQPTPDEIVRRDEVLARVVDYIRADRRITLPPFDASLARPDDRYALISIGLEPNDFSGTIAGYRYQFEGEEDLLHLIVTADAGVEISPEEGQAVAGHVLHGLSPAMIWLKPGQYSQHFYFGHDELLATYA